MFEYIICEHREMHTWKSWWGWLLIGEIAVMVKPIRVLHPKLSLSGWGSEKYVKVCGVGWSKCSYHFIEFFNEYCRIKRICKQWICNLYTLSYPHHTAPPPASLSSLQSGGMSDSWYLKPMLWIIIKLLSVSSPHLTGRNNKIWNSWDETWDVPTIQFLPPPSSLQLFKTQFHQVHHIVSAKLSHSKKYWTELDII